MSEWQKEFNMFSTDALEDMKTYSDNTHEEREWMCYVYEKDGQYELGEPSFGSESRIEVNPTTKAAQDAVKNGLTNRIIEFKIQQHHDKTTEIIKQPKTVSIKKQT